MPNLTCRDLTTLEEYAQVVELERVIWGPGYDEVVPVPILAVTVLRGGVLIGAFDATSTLRETQGRPEQGRGATGSGQCGPMVGFVYSLPGIRHGKPTQWSHMLGVLDEHRNDGTGRRLKLLQRERTLAMGLDLIEWTYDPMQALNAHLNFTKLGVIVEEYEVNVYGTSRSPLHGGNPTDRFVCEWWIRKPHVERRLLGPPKRQGREGGEAASHVEQGSSPELTLRTSELADAGRANLAVPAGEWLVCREIDLALETRRLMVEIPTGFTEMLSQAPELALEWRMATRQIFKAYFARGYRAVEFFLDRPKGKGAYLLTRQA